MGVRVEDDSSQGWFVARLVVLIVPTIESVG